MIGLQGLQLHGHIVFGLDEMKFYKETEKAEVRVGVWLYKVTDRAQIKVGVLSSDWLFCEIEDF